MSSESDSEEKFYDSDGDSLPVCNSLECSWGFPRGEHCVECEEYYCDHCVQTRGCLTFKIVGYYKTDEERKDALLDDEVNNWMCDECFRESIPNPKWSKTMPRRFTSLTSRVLLLIIEHSNFYWRRAGKLLHFFSSSGRQIIMES